MNVLRELRKFKTKSALAKIRILILLTVMLAVSTYAWFYTEKSVNVSNIRGKVTDWDVEYSIDNEVIVTEEIVIAVDEFFPGMEPFDKTVKTTNKTATGADIEYEIKSIRIFGVEQLDYLKDSGNITEAGTTVNFFSKEEYPFNAGYSYDRDSIAGVDPESGEPTDDSVGTLTIFANWSYTRSGAEKGTAENDELDTMYGEQAYEYYQNTALSEQYSPLEIVITITSAREGHLPQN